MKKLNFNSIIINKKLAEIKTFKKSKSQKIEMMRAIQQLNLLLNEEITN